ncbi:MAG: hypothetical protein WBE68_05765, partial [Candidatus Nitrosopolaris sp.]
IKESGYKGSSPFLRLFIVSNSLLQLSITSKSRTISRRLRSHYTNSRQLQFTRATRRNPTFSGSSPNPDGGGAAPNCGMPVITIYCKIPNINIVMFPIKITG